MAQIARVSNFLGLNRSTVGTLFMVILVGMGERMAERFLPIYLLALGGGALSIGLLNGMDNLLSALYSFPGGYLSDRFGRERINTLANIITAAGILCLMNVQRQETLLPILFAFLLGLGYGAAAPMFPSVAADIFLGRSFGLIFAMICICAGMGGALGPLMSGWLRDVTGTYSLSFTMALVSLSLSCLFVWLAAPRKVRRMVRTKS